MAEFKSVGRVQVSLWGHKVGVLVPSPERGYFAFKFDRTFLETGIEIAPLMMPLAEGPYQFTDLPRNAYEGLPPCFADSLPDVADRFAIGTGPRVLKQVKEAFV